MPHKIISKKININPDHVEFDLVLNNKVKSNKKTISFQMSGENLKKLELLAKENNISSGLLAKNLLLTYLKKQ